MAAFLIAAPFSAQAQELNETERTEIENLLRNYILNNGELILESVNKYQEAMMEEQRAEMREKAENFVKTLDERQFVTSVGPDDASVTVVEFFDYNCGFCHKALDAIETVLEQDDDVRFVFIDMPILHETSMLSAKYGLAAHNQDKYWEMHRAIMGMQGEKTDEALLALAEENGLNVKKLKKDVQDEKLTAFIKNNVDQAREMGFTGTPAFIIGSEVIPGFVPAEELQKQIDAARG
jgi:protein-disulfide isomerase